MSIIALMEIEIGGFIEKSPFPATFAITFTTRLVVGPRSALQRKTTITQSCNFVCESSMSWNTGKTGENGRRLRKTGEDWRRREKTGED